MQRWHVTLGLIGLSLTAAVLAPRLFGGATFTPPSPPLLGVPPVLPIAEIEPVLTPVSSGDRGHLKLEAGLDRSSVIAGATSERFVVISVTARAPM